MLTEEEIIRLYVARSEAAISATEERYGSGCTRIARNILGDLRDAEECVNDTWLAAWNTIPPQEPHPLRAYLYRIVRNLSLGRYHYNRAEKRNSLYDVALDELEGCLAAPDGVEDGLTVEGLTAALNRFLEKQSRENRVLFVRRYWYGDPVQELAARLGMRPNSVTARLARLREKLRKELREEGFTV